MALSKLIANLNIHQLKPNNIKGQASATKEYFDKAANDIKIYINDTLTPEVDGLDTDQTMALNTHKTSSDHDGRYYTESEINALLAARTPLTGNHEGTWQGYTPTQTDPGIQAVVDGHTSQLEQLEYNIPEAFVSAREYGALFDGDTDDAAAIQACIDDVPAGTTILLGNSRVFSQLIVDKELTFMGENYVNGNYTNSYPTAKLFFNVSASASPCILGTANINLMGIVVTGNGQDKGIQVTDASLTTDKCVIQGFTTCVEVIRGYYCKLNNSYIGYSENGCIFDYCYNVNFASVSISHVSRKGVILTNGSNLNMHGGSIESITIMGIDLQSNSRAHLFGTYLEAGGWANHNAFINMTENTSLTAIGCHAYLTDINHFVYSTSSNIIVNSHGNYFVYPDNASTTVVQVYWIMGTSGNNINISGDNWASSIGANVVYFYGVTSNERGSMVVHYPNLHPKFKQSINTNIDCQSTSDVTPTGLDAGSVLTFTNGGIGTDDPIGIHFSAWGYNSYRAVYQKGQWEKIGTRLPNQADSAASTVAEITADFNGLLAKLRANGVMI